MTANFDKLIEKMITNGAEDLHHATELLDLYETSLIHSAVSIYDVEFYHFDSKEFHEEFNLALERYTAG